MATQEELELAEILQEHIEAGIGHGAISDVLWLNDPTSMRHERFYLGYKDLMFSVTVALLGRRIGPQTPVTPGYP
jgi:hypothetical protein